MGDFVKKHPSVHTISDVSFVTLEWKQLQLMPCFEIQAAAIVGKKWNMSAFLKELFGAIYGLTWM